MSAKEPNEDNTDPLAKFDDQTVAECMFGIMQEKSILIFNYLSVVIICAGFVVSSANLFLASVPPNLAFWVRVVDISTFALFCSFAFKRVSCYCEWKVFLDLFEEIYSGKRLKKRGRIIRVVPSDHVRQASAKQLFHLAAGTRADIWIITIGSGILLLIALLRHFFL
jgi:hypothetical protein